MRKVNFLFLLGLLFIMTLSLGACSDDENAGSSESIVGTWVLISNEGWIKEDGKIIEEWNSIEDEDESLYHVFHSDGTLEFIDPDDHRVVETGTWKYNKGKLYLHANGEDIAVTVISVSETELVVGIHEKEVEDGTTYEYYEAEHYRRISD